MYVEYLESKHKYLNAQKEYNNILDEKERLFEQTQPSAIKFDGERVDGGQRKNKWDSYLIKLEEKNILERLKEAKSIMQDRKEIFEQTEKDLRNSKETDDKVFVYRYLEKKKVYQITGMINYSEAHVKRFLSNIRGNISKMKR